MANLKTVLQNSVGRETKPSQNNGTPFLESRDANTSGFQRNEKRETTPQRKVQLSPTYGYLFLQGISSHN
jgi:hypothetical protein